MISRTPHLHVICVITIDWGSFLPRSVHHLLCLCIHKSGLIEARKRLWFHICQYNRAGYRLIEPESPWLLSWFAYEGLPPSAGPQFPLCSPCTHIWLTGWWWQRWWHKNWCPPAHLIKYMSSLSPSALSWVPRAITNKGRNCFMIDTTRLNLLYSPHFSFSSTWCCSTPQLPHPAELVE